MIKRIIKIDKFDPIPKGICIYKESKPAARKEEHATL
jgi:hypothetical protein